MLFWAQRAEPSHVPSHFHPCFILIAQCRAFPRSRLPPFLASVTPPPLPCHLPLQLGTMWGIFPKDQADKIVPEGHRHPHYQRSEDSTAGSSKGAAAAADVADSVETSWDGTVGGTYDSTPEDHPDGAAPRQEAAQVQEEEEEQPVAQQMPAQASLRLRPFGSRHQEA